MKKILFTTTALMAVFLYPWTALAHPGNTAADGCHYCRTNCANWGEVAGARHCHGGYTAPAPIVQQQYIAPPPTNKPLPTNTPRPTHTPYPTYTPRPTYTPVPTTTIQTQVLGDTSQPTSPEVQVAAATAEDVKQANIVGIIFLSLIGASGYIGYKKKSKNS